MTRAAAVSIHDEAWKHLEEQRKRRDAEPTSSSPSPRITAVNVILTTVGRCMFNDILPKAMPFYNCTP